MHEVCRQPSKLYSESSNLSTRSNFKVSLY